jgi:GNAT superfamily N-acetyltransferase
VIELRDVPPDEIPARLATVLDRVAGLRAGARFLDPDVAREQVEELADRTRDRADLLDVVDDHRVVGQVWLVREGGGDLVAYDLHLDEPARAAELVPLLVDRARAAGAGMLGVGVNPRDPSRVALGDQPGFLPRATNMALTLDGEIADPGGLELRPMTEVEFDAFLDGSVDEYAGELAAAGMSEEAAAQQSREQMAQLVPDGQASPGMHFFTAWVGAAPVGSLWLCTLDPMAFVYDVVVEESQRRKGYGAAIMNAGALWCRDRGHPVLGLNVFAHNPGARALYDRLGYRVTQDYRALDVADAG